LERKSQEESKQVGDESTNHLDKSLARVASLEQHLDQERRERNAAIGELTAAINCERTSRDARDKDFWGRFAIQDGCLRDRCETLQRNLSETIAKETGLRKLGENDLRARLADESRRLDNLEGIVFVGCSEAQLEINGITSVDLSKGLVQAFDDDRREREKLSGRLDIALTGMMIVEEVVGSERQEREAAVAGLVAAIDHEREAHEEDRTHVQNALANERSSCVGRSEILEKRLELFEVLLEELRPCSVGKGESKDELDARIAQGAPFDALAAFSRRRALTRA
jgi:hypothetical protein